MSITHLTSTSQLNQILSVSKDKLSVIDFHATWSVDSAGYKCGPCHAIAPTFEALSKQYKNVNFLKCDVDSAPDVAQLYSVSAMPTFIFLKGSKKVDQVRGADKAGITNALKKHTSGSSGSPTGAFTGKGQTLGGDQVVENTGPDFSRAVEGVTNLNPQAKVFLGLAAAYLVLWYFT